MEKITKEELNALKEGVEAESKELRQLTDEELMRVSGGREKEAYDCPYDSYCGQLSPCRPCPYVR